MAGLETDAVISSSEIGFPFNVSLSNTLRAATAPSKPFTAGAVSSSATITAKTLSLSMAVLSSVLGSVAVEGTLMVTVLVATPAINAAGVATATMGKMLVSIRASGALEGPL